MTPGAWLTLRRTALFTAFAALLATVGLLASGSLPAAGHPTHHASEQHQITALAHQHVSAAHRLVPSDLSLPGATPTLVSASAPTAQAISQTDSFSTVDSVRTRGPPRAG